MSQAFFRDHVGPFAIAASKSKCWTLGASDECFGIASNVVEIAVAFGTLAFVESFDWPWPKLRRSSPGIVRPAVWVFSPAAPNRAAPFDSNPDGNVCRNPFCDGSTFLSCDLRKDIEDIDASPAPVPVCLGFRAPCTCA